MRINISYCRMENTYLALREAFDNWENENGQEEMTLSPLSESEQEYRRRLVDLCREIVDNFGDDE